MVLTPTTHPTHSTSYDHPIYLSGWIARKSVRLYVDKKYRCHYLAMLGHEPPQNMSLASVSGRKDYSERTEMEEWKKEEEDGGGGWEDRGGGREGREGSGGEEGVEEKEGGGGGEGVRGKEGSEVEMGDMKDGKESGGCRNDI